VPSNRLPVVRDGDKWFLKIVFRLNAARFAFGFLPLFHTACESLLLVIPWVGFQGEDTRRLLERAFRARLVPVMLPEFRCRMSVPVVFRDAVQPT